MSGERTTYEVDTSGCMAAIVLLAVGTIGVMAAFWLIASLLFEGPS